MVHEFAHAIYRIIGLTVIDPAMDTRGINTAYDTAMATSRWANAYAATNSNKCYAEAVQSYFDTRTSPDRSAATGSHNDIDTREPNSRPTTPWDTPSSTRFSATRRAWTSATADRRVESGSLGPTARGRV